jgi:uncharacterized membrane protein
MPTLGPPRRAVRAWQRYFYYFITCAVLGQIYEVLLLFFWYHEAWQWQGPLHGPWLVIYGVGGVLLLILLEGLLKKKAKIGKLNLMPLVIAALILLIVSVVEYSAHWILDSFFNFRPWDYSEKPFNINGRICLEDSLRFVVLGMFELYVILPAFERLFDRLSKRANFVICVIVLGAFMLDVIISLALVFLK